MPCCWLIVAIGADEGPGASWVMVGFWWSLVVGSSNRAALAAWVFSAKQNFSILRLFLLYSPTVLQATKFMRRSFVSGGFGRFSEEMAMSLLRITVFFGYVY